MARELASGVLASAGVGMVLAWVVALVVLADLRNNSVISRLVKICNYKKWHSNIPIQIFT